MTENNSASLHMGMCRTTMPCTPMKMDMKKPVLPRDVMELGARTTILKMHRLKQHQLELLRIGIDFLRDNEIMDLSLQTRPGNTS